MIFTKGSKGTNHRGSLEKSETELRGVNDTPRILKSKKFL